MPLPYTDSFDSYPVGREARYLADMDGAFEVVACGGGRGGRCVRQMAPQAPILWRTGGQRILAPCSVTSSWTNYTVSADMLLEKAGYVELQGRVGTQGRTPKQLNAYFLRVADTGAWSIIRSDGVPSETVLASGTGTALGTNAWHTLALAFTGSTITATVDGVRLGSATDTAYAAGQVGIATSQFLTAQFDNLSIVGTPVGSPPAGTYKIINANSGYPLSVAGDGTLVEQATDTGAAQQRWTLSTAGGFATLTNGAGGGVLTAPGTTKGARLEVRTGSGGATQQWVVTGSGGQYTIANRGSGLLSDVKSAATTPGAPVIQWSPNDGANQRWRFVPA